MDTAADSSNVEIPTAVFIVLLSSQLRISKAVYDSVQLLPRLTHGTVRRLMGLICGDILRSENAADLHSMDLFNSAEYGSHARKSSAVII